MSTTTPKQIRMEDEVFEQFKSLQKESGLSASQLMGKFVTLFETEELKQLTPEITTNVEQMESLMHAMRTLYIGQLESAKLVKTTVTAEFESRRKADLTTIAKQEEEIQDLKKKIEELEKENKNLTEKINKKKESEDISKQLSEVMKMLEKSKTPETPKLVEDTKAKKVK